MNHKNILIISFSATLMFFPLALNAQAAQDVLQILQQSSGNTIIVDARRNTDYQAGHIDGAINIPTTLCAAGRNAKLANTPKDSRVIIYCQSAGCPYAEVVATHLKEDGFHNFAIYKGGWVDWNKRQESRGHDETKN